MKLLEILKRVLFGSDDEGDCNCAYSVRMGQKCYPCDYCGWVECLCHCEEGDGVHSNG